MRPSAVSELDRLASPEIKNHTFGVDFCRKTLHKWTRQVKLTPGAAGGVEGPVDDGYSWRKYGQKDILGAKHPRSPIASAAPVKQSSSAVFLITFDVYLQSLLQMHPPEHTGLSGDEASAAIGRRPAAVRHHLPGDALVPAKATEQGAAAEEAEPQLSGFPNGAGS